MKAKDFTISSGKQELLAKVKHHRAEADRLERLATTLHEVELALHEGSGQVAPKAGRPANTAHIKKIKDAIDAMPPQFSLPDLKAKLNGMDINIFRRTFREIKADGTVEERIKANGRQPGLYVKKEQAAP